MGKRSKIISARVNPEKLKILEDAKISVTQFVNRALEVFEESWRLSGYKDNVKFGKALAMKLQLDKIKAERRVIQKHLKDINQSIKKANHKLPYPLYLHDKVEWLVENAPKDKVDSEKLKKIFDKVANEIKFREGKTLKEYMEKIYEGHTSPEHIKSCATFFSEDWRQITENFKLAQRELNLYTQFQERFEKMLEANKQKEAELQIECLESLTKEQIESACNV